MRQQLLCNQELRRQVFWGVTLFFYPIAVARRAGLSDVQRLDRVHLACAGHALGVGCTGAVAAAAMPALEPAVRDGLHRSPPIALVLLAMLWGQLRATTHTPLAATSFSHQFFAIFWAYQNAQTQANLAPAPAHRDCAE